ncbi:MAG: type 1 glutamine amidotransferase [Proteobacteria bacterium]|nr:type 1 glutamine amidotransferase [Pseudomonadota bacterium]MBU1059792.1 type 1 glutamine amidotransferase [Pseudomonadota bacterium]
MATIHWLQHVPFEGLGSLEEWLLEQGYDLCCTRLWAGELFPDLDCFAGLVVMGGPMGVFDHEAYPWLVREKVFLRSVIDRGIPILGICLGAQLLAAVLGAEVRKNPEKEIGWFPVVRTLNVPAFLRPVLPQEVTVFHWHGDTFTLPDGAVRLYASKACANQAFLYKDHVLGLQFHLETTRDSVAALIDNCRQELVAAPWIQSEEEMLSSGGRFAEINGWMHQLFKCFFSLRGEEKDEGGL